MQQYEHNYNLKFHYPDNWLAEYDDGQIVFENCDNPMGALLFSVFYSPAEEEVSLIQWLEEMLEVISIECSIKADEHYACF